METTDGRDVATDVCAVPVQFVVSFYHSFRDGVKTLLGAFFRSKREDVGSVCLHISSMSTFRIVSFRGEGLPVFVCAVRSAAHQHNVCCIVSTNSISCVFNCVLISSVAVCVCVSTFCVVCRARQPSTYHRCACVLCSVRDKHRQLNR